MSKVIETELERGFSPAVEIQDIKHDMGDTAEGTEDDQKFLADVKYRTEELVALTDTIKMPNDDDALELLKKTLRDSVSALQVGVSTVTDAVTRLYNSPQLDLSHGL